LPLKPDNRIFVPLCGKSIDMLWLVQQGYEVIGHELSVLACHAFFEENGISVEYVQEEKFTVFKSPGITLFAGDFFKLDKTLLANVDAVYDRAALIALPSDMRKKYVNQLRNLIPPLTPIFLITTDYPQEDMQGPPFSVGEAEVHALFEGASIHQLYNRAFKTMPDHLMRRGLRMAYEQAYYIR
jgi:thiopurine S-methyltransferase